MLNDPVFARHVVTVYWEELLQSQPLHLGPMLDGL